MARKTLVDSRTLPYHVTARSNNREAFPGDLQFIWETLASELLLQSWVNSIRVHAFVLMPNHFHLILSTPRLPVSHSMGQFLSASTRTINNRYKRWGRVFGGRYHWTLISDPLYFAHALKYVYRNPVKAELCLDVEEYPFSTYAGRMGRFPLPVPLFDPDQSLCSCLPEDRDSFANLSDWLNHPHRKEQQEAIRRALKKPEFKLPIDRVSRKSVELDLPF